MPKHDHSTHRKRHFLKKLLWCVVYLSFAWLFVFILLRQSANNGKTNINTKFNNVTFQPINQSHYKNISSTAVCQARHLISYQNSSANILPHLNDAQLAKINTPVTQPRTTSNNISQSPQKSPLTTQKKYVLNILNTERADANTTLINAVLNYQFTTLIVTPPSAEYGEELKAFLSSDVVQLAELLQLNHLDMLIYQNERFFTLLEFAARENLAEIAISILTSHYRDKLEYSADIYLKTLEYAIKHNNWLITKALIDFKKEFTDLSQFNNALNYSCYLGNLNILQQLLNHQYFSFTNNNIQNRIMALITALNGGNLNVADYIYNYQSGMAHYRDIDNQNILHKAIMMYSDFKYSAKQAFSVLTVIDFMGKLDPELIITGDKYNQTPHSLAKKQGFTIVVNLLNRCLDKRNRSNEISDKTHSNANFNIYNLSKYLFPLLGTIAIGWSIVRFYLPFKTNRINKIISTLITLNKLTADILSTQWQHIRWNQFQIELIFKTDQELASLMNKEFGCKKQFTIDKSKQRIIVMGFLQEIFQEAGINSIQKENHLQIYYNFNDAPKFNKQRITKLFTELYMNSEMYKNSIVNSLNTLFEKIVIYKWQSVAQHQFELQLELMAPAQLANNLMGHSFNSLTLPLDRFISILNLELSKLSSEKGKFLILSNTKIIFNLKHSIMMARDFSDIWDNLKTQIINQSNEYQQAAMHAANNRQLNEIKSLHDNVSSYVNNMRLILTQPAKNKSIEMHAKFNRDGIENINSQIVMDAIRKHILLLETLEKLHCTALLELSATLEKTTVLLNEFKSFNEKSSTQSISEYANSLKRYQHNLESLEKTRNNINLTYKETVTFFDEPLRELVRKHPAHRNNNNKHQSAKSIPTASISSSSQPNEITATPSISADSQPFVITPSKEELTSTTLQTSIQSYPMQSSSSDSNQTNTAPVLKNSVTVSPQPTLAPSIAALSNSSHSLFASQNLAMPNLTQNAAAINPVDYYAIIGFGFSGADETLLQIQLCINNILVQMENKQPNLTELKFLVKTLCFNSTIYQNIYPEKFEQCSNKLILLEGIEKIYNPSLDFGNNAIQLSDPKVLIYCQRIKELITQFKIDQAPSYRVV